MNKKISCLVIIFAVFIYGFLYFEQSQNSAFASQKITVVDILGRRVELNNHAKRIVAIGPGAMRLCCYFQNLNLIVGIEKIDKDRSIGRPYLMANPSFKKLPLIGLGGPNNSPDPEKILLVKPDVIFSMYSYEKASADNLYSKTGIPVVALSYGKTSVFDPAIDASLKLIGKVIGMDQRAVEIIRYIKKCKDDLDGRTRDIPENMKPTVYVGGLGMRGVHGIESTQANYSLFNAVNAKNVVDETGKTGYLMIDKEKILSWNPKKIFLDCSGLQMVKNDYKKKPRFYESLSALKNNEIYSQLPFNYYYTNITTAIADAYYIGKVCYPEKFKGVNPVKKADEIYRAFLGKNIYSMMAKDFGGFKKLSLK